jgi:hypothetical protein
LGELKLNNSALQTDHGGMGSVVGAQFGEDVPDLALDGVFSDRQLNRNLFVTLRAISFSCLSFCATSDVVRNVEKSICRRSREFIPKDFW